MIDMVRCISLNNQGMTTTGGCRYRQAIPVGIGGRLDVDTNYGIRKAFLPQVKHTFEFEVSRIAILNITENHSHLQKTSKLYDILVIADIFLRP